MSNEGDGSRTREPPRLTLGLLTRFSSSPFKLRMKKQKISLLVTGLFLVAGGEAFAAELRLVYDVKIEQSVDKGRDKKEEKEFRHRSVVALGSGYLYFTDPDGSKIYDFNKNRILYVDDPGKTVSDVSLFSDIGFRFLEFRNRLYIRDVVLTATPKAKNPQPAIESIFDLETLFGIGAPDMKVSEITEKGEDGKVIYGPAEGPAVECQLSVQAMTSDQRALWEKYLVYGCRIHPQIRRKMASLERAPEFIRYSYRDAGKTVTVAQTLVKASVDASDSYKLPSGYQKLYGPPGEELNMLLAGVWEGTSPVKQFSESDFSRIVAALVAQNSYFDAALASIEYSLQAGVELPQAMKKAVDESRAKDERAKIFFENLAPTDKLLAERATKALEKIKRKGLTRGHVIDIMIADGKAIAGDFKGTRELFLKVLKINPYLAGVYKDLGDLLNRNFYVVSAWQCWDTVRFLYPKHKMLKQVDDYEAWLRKTFSDFFLAGEPAPVMQGRAA